MQKADGMLIRVEFSAGLLYNINVKRGTVNDKPTFDSGVI